MSPRQTHHTAVPVTLEARAQLDEIVDALKAAGQRGVSRATVIQQLATLYGPALIRHLTEPVRVGGGREER